MSKTNLCILGLSQKFTDDICRQLSVKMDMYYADVSKILEYELSDLSKVEEMCGVEYLQKEERSIINRICSYDNTIVNIEYSSLNDDSTLKVVRDSCLLVYIKLNKDRFILEQNKESISENVKNISLDVFEDRDFICKRISDITINCLDLKEDELIDMIIQQILKYYS